MHRAHAGTHYHPYPSPAPDDQLFPPLTFPCPTDCVVDTNRLYGEPCKDLPHVWVIVDGQDHLPRYGAHRLSECVVLLKGEVNPIPFSLPVRRVGKEEGLRPVILFHAALPVEMLDGDPGEAQVRLAEIFLEAEQVKPRRLHGTGAESLPADLAAEAHLLQEEEPRRPLDVGEDVGRGLLQPAENLSADQGVLELAAELLEVVLNHPIFAFIVIGHRCQGVYSLNSVSVDDGQDQRLVSIFSRRLQSDGQELSPSPSLTTVVKRPITSKSALNTKKQGFALVLWREVG